MSSHSGKRDGWAWTATEDAALKTMVCNGYTAHDAANHLERSAADVALRCGQTIAAASSTCLVTGGDNDADDAYSLSFDSGSEEHLALLDLALCGVQLDAAILWCTGHPDRASACRIDNLRCVPSFAGQLEFASRVGLWATWNSDEEFEALDLLMRQPIDSVQAMVGAMLAAFEAPRPINVLRRLGKPAPVQAPPIVSDATQWLGTIAQRMATMGSPDGVKHAAKGQTSSSWKMRKYGGTRKRGSSRGYRRRSPSYPAEAPTCLGTGTSRQPIKDTRTAAEKDWEKLTSW